MPSFDVVSEIDLHEVTNAVDQASREVGTRFDFKGTDSRFEQEAHEIRMTSQSEFQLEQMLDVLRGKMAKRGIDVQSMEVAEPEASGKTVRQKITMRHGIDAEMARKIVRSIKDSKLKVQASIQGDKVRVTGKKRDDLQEAIAILRQSEVGLPLQFNNFRD